MKKFNILYIPIVLAAIAQGVLWVNLFSLIHHGIMAYIGGIPAGLSIVTLVTYSANALPRIQSKRARQGGWIMLVLVLIAEPIVLGVVNWWYMPAAFQATVGSYVVAGGASLVISLVLVLGALVDRSLVPAEKTSKLQDVDKKESVKVASKQGKTRKASLKVARKAITDSDLIVYLQANEGASQQQVADHFGVSRQAIGQRVKRLFEVKSETSHVHRR